MPGTWFPSTFANDSAPDRPGAEHLRKGAMSAALDPEGPHPTKRSANAGFFVIVALPCASQTVILSEDFEGTNPPIG